MTDFETIVVRPGRLRPGDVVSDHEASRTFEIESIAPIMIQYWNLMVAVYWIKGLDTQSGRVDYEVQTVCLPRSTWYVMARRTRQAEQIPA